MTKKLLTQIGLYLMVAAVFATCGAGIDSIFGGNANTGLLPETSGGTGRVDITQYITDYSATLRPKINNASVTSSTSVYAPTGSGTAAYGLISSGGTTAPTWQPVQKLQTVTGATESNMAIGTTILSYIWASESLPAQNTTVTLYYRGDSTFVVNHAPASPGFQMSGTWVARGVINHLNNGWSNSVMVQRIA